MDGTRELVDAAQVGTALVVLSLLALLAAPALLFLGRKLEKPVLVRCGLLAAAVVALYPLWLVYNRIEDHFGLDSVAALLINMALFILVGAAGGLVLRRCWPADQSPG